MHARDACPPRFEITTSFRTGKRTSNAVRLPHGQKINTVTLEDHGGLVVDEKEEEESSSSHKKYATTTT